MTHRRDCECVRCDAGFRPTEQDRVRARQRWEVAREHAAAQTMLARRRERTAIKNAALTLELEAEARAVDARIRTLRSARARADGDPQLAALERLRAAGVPLADALAQVDKLVADWRAPANDSELPDSRTR